MEVALQWLPYVGLGLLVLFALSWIKRGSAMTRLQRDLDARTEEVNTKDQEISGLKNTNEELRGEKASLHGELHALQESLCQMGLGLVTIDSTGVTRFANQVGVSHGTKIGEKLSSILDEGDEDFLDRQLNSEARGVDVRLRGTDSRVIFVRWTSRGSTLPSLKLGPDDRLLLFLPVTRENVAHLIAAGVQDERSKLASLLTHGVLNQSLLMWKHRKIPPMFRHFARVLYQRFEVVAHVLVNWDPDVLPAKKMDAGTDADQVFYEVRSHDTYRHLNILSWMGAYAGGNKEVRDLISGVTDS
jgi:hypothetical protein